MASARVAHMLDEIARLSHEEQAELVRDLPRVLHQGDGGVNHGGLPVEAVERAAETRERIRQRLANARQSPGSIDEDLDDVRNGRLSDLLDSSVTRNHTQ